MRRTVRFPVKRVGAVALAGLGLLAFVWGPSVLAMDGPDQVQLDALKNVYEAVEFPHALHVGVASCAACHHHTLGTSSEDKACLQCHAGAAAAAEAACTACHGISSHGATAKTLAKNREKSGAYHLERTGLKRAYHLGCLGCHQEMGGPTGCEDCHEKKIQAGSSATR